MNPQPLSDYHQQLQQSWAIAKPIPKRWHLNGRVISRKPVSLIRIAPIAIAWSTYNSQRRTA